VNWRLTQALSLDLASRIDRIDTQLPLADRLTGGRVGDDAVSGGVGALWRFDPAWSLAVNVRRGFRAPNVNDLAQVGRRSNNRIVIANPQLTSESLWSIDAGVGAERRSGSFELTGFRSRYRGRIALIDTGVVHANGQNGRVRTAGCLKTQNRNVARATYSGVEAGVQFAVGSWAMSGSLKYTYREQTIDGVTAPANRVPPHNGVVAAEWRPTERWELGLRVDSAARQNRLDTVDLRDNRIDPTGTPSHAAVEAALTYRPNERITMRAVGGNLVDASYRNHGSGIDAAGRSLSLSIDYSFGAIN
jgi:outer membrane receptor protein involved in Fe transport